MRVYFAWGNMVGSSNKPWKNYVWVNKEMKFEVSSAAELVALRRKHKPMWVAFDRWCYECSPGCDMAAAFYRVALSNPDLSPVVKDALLAQRREDSTRPPKGTRI